MLLFPLEIQKFDSDLFGKQDRSSDWKPNSNCKSKSFRSSSGKFYQCKMDIFKEANRTMTSRCKKGKYKAPLTIQSTL